ncbi:chitinase-like protein Idgf4 [Anopheles aquasalis]|uniref:chitinase-like protein Idgf4 n=1 Tax=Anopheles aquasalis TaxID=42839 RepID=UPI00215ABD68|nr:chitinase-like protein Idgf4 [Anopheles aquasalis]
MGGIARNYVVIGLAVLFFCTLFTSATNVPKVLCYYDGEASLKSDALAGKVTLSDVGPALAYCTHLVYGYVGIDATTYRLKALNEALDLDSGKGQFRVATGLKYRFPGLKVFLSVGAYYDLAAQENSASAKYLTLLESSESRAAFIDSTRKLLKEYGFDGLDLAWQFPQSKPKGNADTVLDSKATEHREQFITLVRDLLTAFDHDKLELGYTQLPHVNETVFLDIPKLNNLHLQYISINAFDQQIPQRNPNEADYLAPLYEPQGRVPGKNIEASVYAWTKQGTAPTKIVVGIPTYGRGWKLVKESGTAGVPPVRADGPSPIKSYSTYAGYYSYGEVCSLLATGTSTNPMHKVHDPRFGPYAFRVADGKEENGIWLTYEDAESATNKARYVKEAGLGGIAVNDLADDDYMGRCSIETFSITLAVGRTLSN